MLVPISEENFCGFKAWRIGAPDGSSALVAQRGATLLSWRPLGGSEVIDGYGDGEELASGSDGRCLVMAPWVGKIAGGAYTFGGTRIDLPHELAAREGFGALVSGIDFVRREAGDALRLVAEIAAGPAYPWDFELSVLFALEAGVGSEAHLSVTIEARNLGDTPAPMCLGWLPYVTLPGRSGISNLSVTVPARTKVMASGGIPLNGDAAYGGICAPESIGYIGASRIERAYTDLVPDENGVVKTVVSDPVSGASVTLTQEPSEARVVYVSTGDNFAHRPRSSIGLGPCSALANAFNRADEAARLVLPSGESRSLTSTLTFRS